MANTPKSAEEWRKLAREASDPGLAAGYMAKAAAVDKERPPGTHLGFVGPCPKPVRKYTSADILKAIRSATPAQRAEFRAQLTGIAAPTPVAKVAAPDLTKLATLKDDIVEATKAAFAETTKGFEAEIARIRKMADTGGPMRLAPRSEPATDRHSADYYRRLATEVNDPALAAEYRARAASADARSDRR